MSELPARLAPQGPHPCRVPAGGVSGQASRGADGPRNATGRAKACNRTGQGMHTCVRARVGSGQAEQCGLASLYIPNMLRQGFELPDGQQEQTYVRI